MCQWVQRDIRALYRAVIIAAWGLAPKLIILTIYTHKTYFSDPPIEMKYFQENAL